MTEERLRELEDIARDEWYGLDLADEMELIAEVRRLQAKVAELEEFSSELDDHASELEDKADKHYEAEWKWLNRPS